MKPKLNQSIILITGGSGSWGQELTTQLLQRYSPKEIRIYSRGEHKQVEMKRKLADPRVKYIIGDIRDKQRLLSATKNVDFIFHLAALKHVPVCEENPWEAVQTNIIGTQNIIDVANENQVKKVIDVSTDKAVDPLNLYGVTKACGERLIIAANQMSSTQFVCVRGGNVLGTNGSVIPLFKEQILKLNQITLTDPAMTRFLMRIEDAIKLVLKAAVESVGGEIFVMKMPSCYIKDLAKTMIESLGNPQTKIIEIGIRPGEKINELLVSQHEISRTINLGKYFVVLPQINIPATLTHYKKYKHSVLEGEYASNNKDLLKPEEIKTLLKADGWLNSELNNDSLKYLETLDSKTLFNFFKSERWVKPNE